MLLSHGCTRLLCPYHGGRLQQTENPGLLCGALTLGTPLGDPLLGRCLSIPLPHRCAATYCTSVVNAVTVTVIWYTAGRIPMSHHEGSCQIELCCNIGGSSLPESCLRLAGAPSFAPSAVHALLRKSQKPAWMRMAIWHACQLELSGLSALPLLPGAIDRFWSCHIPADPPESASFG